MATIIGRSLTPLNSSRTMGASRRRDDNSRGKVQNVRGDSWVVRLEDEDRRVTVGLVSAELLHLARDLLGDALRQRFVVLNRARDHDAGRAVRFLDPDAGQGRVRELDVVAGRPGASGATLRIQCASARRYASQSDPIVTSSYGTLMLRRAVAGRWSRTPSASMNCSPISALVREGVDARVLDGEVAGDGLDDGLARMVESRNRKCLHSATTSWRASRLSG